MSDSQITSEVSQQFLRRTPVKLRQFSRLLNDMLTQKIEPLRVKALLSQVNKTRESCLAHQYDNTAKLLNQLLSQLSLSDEALETQRPLLKRLSIKLQEHSEKLELGVRPEKASLHDKQKVMQPGNLPVEQTDNSADSTNQQTKQESAESDQTESPDKTVTETSDTEKDSTIGESSKRQTSMSILSEHRVLLEKNTVIFADADPQRFHLIQQQFESLGVDVKFTESLGTAKQWAIEDPGSVIIASLNLADTNEQLSDDEVEQVRMPLIFTAERDNQQERLRGLRSGGTGFLVEPVSISGLLEQIEQQTETQEDTPYRVLIMEDSKAQARFYEKVLSKGHFDVRIVTDPTVLFDALRGFEPETILMDMQMPTCSGIELTRIIRQIPRFTYLPIIFLSAEESNSKQNQALLAGGTSFIVKPVDKEQLMFLAGLYTKRFRLLNPQIGVNPDTGLPYSAEFKRNISIESARTSRNGRNIALAVIQLDGADELIKAANYSAINIGVSQLALLLKKRLRKTDIIGHLETGQLGVILSTGSPADWKSIMDEVRLHFAELPFHWHDEQQKLTISIGLAVLSIDWDAHRWFELARNNLHTAMANGGDQIHTN
ncbi:response regulator [Aliikangiella maris]|uniref:Response regulator n=2 Tax=Aliikangiella maris TaxID=3162458 RepID=A0ABV3MP65_9GAMM